MFYYAPWNEMKGAKQRGSMPRSFYYAPWNGMKGAKTKGFDAPKFLLHIFE
jgi:hypothetical protein